MLGERPRLIEATRLNSENKLIKSKSKKEVEACSPNILFVSLFATMLSIFAYILFSFSVISAKEFFSQNSFW